ncbi:MAG TPA: LytTR family DNA-binding domain-containing protein [Bacteroidia bacterium]|nr:LytTR family DNA-binding domain-containing protein [Bacteroidia bacterium]
MKALVIDNEKNIRTTVVDLITAFCPQITSVAEADGVVSGLKKIHELQPDIVFTDVEMDDGTGMDMLSKLGDIKFQVIFITAHNKYAIDAFRFSAIDFLTKPINPDELAKSVQKAESNIKNKLFLEQVAVMNEKNLTKAEKKIVLKELDAIHIIKVKDLICCEASGIYTTFFIDNNKQIVVSKNLKEYEEILEPYDFLRVHNSFLINANKIEKFEKNDGGFLIMEGGQRVPVSQRKKDVVISFLKNF